MMGFKVKGFGRRKKKSAAKKENAKPTTEPLPAIVEKKSVDEPSQASVNESGVLSQEEKREDSSAVFHGEDSTAGKRNETMTADNRNAYPNIEDGRAEAKIEDRPLLGNPVVSTSDSDVGVEVVPQVDSSVEMKVSVPSVETVESEITGDGGAIVDAPVPLFDAEENASKGKNQRGKYTEEKTEGDAYDKGEVKGAPELATRSASSTTTGANVPVLFSPRQMSQIQDIIEDLLNNGSQQIAQISDAISTTISQTSKSVEGNEKGEKEIASTVSSAADEPQKEKAFAKENAGEENLKKEIGEDDKERACNTTVSSVSKSFSLESLKQSFEDIARNLTDEDDKRKEESGLTEKKHEEEGEGDWEEKWEAKLQETRGEKPQHSKEKHEEKQEEGREEKRDGRQEDEWEEQKRLGVEEKQDERQGFSWEEKQEEKSTEERQAELVEAIISVTEDTLSLHEISDAEVLNALGVIIQRVRETYLHKNNFSTSVESDTVASSSVESESVNSSSLGELSTSSEQENVQEEIKQFKRLISRTPENSRQKILRRLRGLQRSDSETSIDRSRVLKKFDFDDIQRDVKRKMREDLEERKDEDIEHFDFDDIIREVKRKMRKDGDEDTNDRNIDNVDKSSKHRNTSYSSDATPPMSGANARELKAHEKQIEDVEKVVFGRRSKGSVRNRLENLEITVFGKVKKGRLGDRIAALTLG